MNKFQKDGAEKIFCIKCENYNITINITYFR